MKKVENAEGEEQWDKRKIVIALCIVVVLLVGGGYLVKNVVFNRNWDFSKKEVQGASAEKENKEEEVGKGVSEDSSLSLEKAFEEKVGELKKQVDNLNVAEVATASPQIQKIIKDFNSLKEYPGNEIKNICRQICGL